ncbi:10360_t:CDS:2, partial [Racocetra persica]
YSNSHHSLCHSASPRPYCQHEDTTKKIKVLLLAAKLNELKALSQQSLNNDSGQLGVDINRRDKRA